MSSASSPLVEARKSRLRRSFYKLTNSLTCFCSFARNTPTTSVSATDLQGSPANERTKVFHHLSINVRLLATGAVPHAEQVRDPHADVTATDPQPRSVEATHIVFGLEGNFKNHGFRGVLVLFQNFDDTRRVLNSFKALLRESFGGPYKP